MVDQLTTALGSLGPDLLSLAGIGIGISVSLFGLRKGYSVVKGFVSK